MMKLCYVLLVIGFLFIAADSAPFRQNELAEAAASGDWSRFQNLVQNKFRLSRLRMDQNFQSMRQRMDQNFQSMRQRMDQNFQSMRQRLNQAANFVPDFESIRSLQPQGPDSQVYGEAQYSFHTSSNVNGQKSEQRGGRRVINKNGVVEEYELS